MLSIFPCFHFILTHYICRLMVLQKPCQENFGKYQEFGETRFGSSEKDHYFSKILKWQHKLVWDYKQGKLVSYFLNNAAKICLYGLKISEKIEIEHVFQSFSLKHFFILVAISTQIASVLLMFKVSILFIFLQRWINANFFELIDIDKNMKRNERSGWSFKSPCRRNGVQFSSFPG